MRTTIVIALFSIITTNIYAIQESFNECSTTFSMRLEFDLHDGDTMYIEQLIGGEWVVYDYLFSEYNYYYGIRQTNSDSIRTRFVIYDEFSYMFYGFYNQPTEFETDCPEPLPITLKSFKAEPAEDFNKLMWVTASEINNQYFIIEKSIDIVNWISIGQVFSRGNSIADQQYSFIDDNICKEVCYYRLSQVDNDGTKVSFDIISLSNTHTSFLDYNILGQIH